VYGEFFDASIQGRLQLIVGAAKVNFGWKLGPFILATVNHSPVRNKKTTTALDLICVRKWAVEGRVMGPDSFQLRILG